ncbi:nucleolin-like [Synchiropus splendidus]|uniref:nucleolin-like n=1 Tax=Synchiropus splendidus TaxID=270530 RepID=UPI00237DFEE9|nr:nucleolin-like [Synchiropus splendidus]
MTEDTSTISSEKVDQEVKAKKKVNRKRKAQPKVQTPPLKKTKSLNDGYCLFVGNLNYHNTYENVKDSLGKYLMTQSLLVQDVRLDRSRKHAFVDLASEMDLTKALTLNGELLLDRPMRIAKAKVKTEEVVKEKEREEVKEEEEEKAPERNGKVSSKTLFVLGLNDKTTTVTLQVAFEGAVNAKISHQRTVNDQRYGFVRFEDEELCKSSKEAMQDCEIDGSKVTVAFATGRAKTKGSVARPAGHGAGQTVKRRGKGKKQGPKSSEVNEKS